MSWGDTPPPAVAGLKGKEKIGDSLIHRDRNCEFARWVKGRFGSWMIRTGRMGVKKCWEWDECKLLKDKGVAYNRFEFTFVSI
ncbi:hypothetical protein KS4_34170 [Poriferisphaera corsica]|uniref:Uncharacterized protein n=1 Tax=Poriferisphaera corsica TaxID=2528020 RepID=A0A517YYQ5_9BACT|nr:hypothetical protein KS4_34170 [Poriferisphaera corsica]